MGGSIFALRMSQAKPQEVTPITGIPWDDGLRAMLDVRMVVAKLQTTVLFGNSLYMIWYDIGPLTRQDGFSAFLKPIYGRDIYAAELSQPPYAATPALYNMVSMGVPLPPPPVATGTVRILDSGFDPFRGYWIEFHGNYYLKYFPLFQDWPNVVNDTANFKGAKPSQNNPNPTPGSGGSGGGVGGTGGLPPTIPPTTC